MILITDKTNIALMSGSKKSERGTNKQTRKRKHARLSLFQSGCNHSAEIITVKYLNSTFRLNAGDSIECAGGEARVKLRRCVYASRRSSPLCRSSGALCVSHRRHTGAHHAPYVSTTYLCRRTKRK